MITQELAESAITCMNSLGQLVHQYGELTEEERLTWLNESDDTTINRLGYAIARIQDNSIAAYMHACMYDYNEATVDAFQGGLYERTQRGSLRVDYAPETWEEFQNLTEDELEALMERYASEGL